MQITKRDECILKILYKFRFATSQQVHYLLMYDEWNSQIKDVTRRLKELYNNGYVQRDRGNMNSHFVYTLDTAGMAVIGVDIVRPLSLYNSAIRHELLVIDTLIYFQVVRGYNPSEIETERQLMLTDIELAQGYDLFSSSSSVGPKELSFHLPDLVVDNIAIEIELTRKKNSILYSNLLSNDRTFNKQVWIIPRTEVTIKKFINDFKKDSEHQIEIIFVDEITFEVKKKIRGGR